MLTIPIADTYHETLANCWAAYHDVRGKARPTQVARVMAQLNTIDLERMLADRGFEIETIARQFLAAA